MQFTISFLKILWAGIQLASPLLGSMVVFIIILGLLVGRIESWRPFEAIYWALITALTIGYGDVKPLLRSTRVLAIVIGLTGIGFTGILVSITVDAASRALDVHLS